VGASDTIEPAELPPVYTGSGRDVVGADDTTKVVKAVPCGTSARETVGFSRPALEFPKVKGAGGSQRFGDLPCERSRPFESTAPAPKSST